MIGPATSPARSRRPIPQGGIPGAFATRTPRGRRSPALAWTVRTAAGHPRYLSGLQRAALLWLTSQASYGRHETTVTQLAAAIGCGRGTASKVLVRLRSLDLIGAYRPTRGRVGGFRFFRVAPGTAAAAHQRNRVRWPSLSANDSTPTPFGGYLTREGMRRSWLASAGDRSGGPPLQRPPSGGSRAGPRARGRPWPPRYTDERCHLDGGRVRLVRSGLRGAPSGDLAASYAARCPRCRSVIAASVVLVTPTPGPVAVGTLLGAPPAPASGPSTLAAAAAAVIPELRHAGQVDRLRVDHLGYRRRMLVIPPIRPAIAGGVDTDVDVAAAAAWTEALADLATVTTSRALEPPTDG